MPDYLPGMAPMGSGGHPVPAAAGLIQVGPPLGGPNSAPPPDDPVGEEPQEEVKESPIAKLLGQFYAEIDLADYARQGKEIKWIRVMKYLAGKDPTDIPVDYQESTFLYRRLPRLTQIAKAKLFKHVCPLQGRPYEVNPSPRHKGGEDSDKEARNMALSRLREEIEDTHTAMELENLLDDICQSMSDLGAAVLYGPIKLSQPRIRWQDGSETADPADAYKAMWKFYDPRSAYPDPNAKKREELEFVHFHHVLSQHQIRNLQEDSTFIPAELAQLLIDSPDGNWSGNQKKWESLPFPANMNNSSLRRYITWMRVGFLDAEALEALGEVIPQTEEYKELRAFKGLDKPQRRAMVESLWEIWFCDKHVIKISKRKFQPNILPVYFIPFRRDPNSIFGIGPGEAALEVSEMLINICRSIDDALNDTAGFQVAIDAGRLENTDLHVQGRKTWLYRNKTGTAAGSGAANTGKPIEFFTVPSNLPHLMEAFKLFESMIPVVTGVNEQTVGKDLGSGVRTDNMLNDMWDSLEEFIRDVVGNVDRYFWKPHLRDLRAWIGTYHPDRASMALDADVQVQGVRGALRREIVGRKLKELYTELHQFGLPSWFDERELGKAIMEGIGIEQERAILSDKQFVQAQELKAEMDRLKQASGRDEAGEKERATTSVRDTMLNLFKAIISQDKANANLVPILERIYKLTGEVDPKAEVALAIWARQMAKNLEAMGDASQQEGQILQTPMKADNPLELAPGSRDPQQALEAAKAGPGPKTPPNPLPPAPTTQQVAQ